MLAHDNKTLHNKYAILFLCFYLFLGVGVGCENHLIMSDTCDPTFHILNFEKLVQYTFNKCFQQQVNPNK